MVDDIKAQFTEDDDVARAKAWWKENGTSIIGGIIIGLTAVIGFNYWKDYRQSTGEAASQLFQQVLQDENNNTSEAAQELFNSYPDTPYAANAALLLAAYKVDKGDLESAEKYLRQALEKSTGTVVEHVARTRLASVLLELERFDDVLTLLQGDESHSFNSRYQELIGDAYALKGDIQAATNAYERSLQNSSGGKNVSMVRLKLENLDQ